MLNSTRNLTLAQRKGEISKDLRALLNLGLKAVLISLFGIVAFGCVSFISAPFLITAFVNSWFTGSLIYLAAISYGIVNDIIGCHVNLPYFLIGHQPGQRGVVKSNNPTTVGIAWGILAVAPLAIIAAVIFSAATLITGLIGLPYLGFIISALILCIPLVNLYAHITAQKTAAQSTVAPRHVYEWGLDDYQKDKLRLWLRTEKDAAAWMSNGTRNLTGYIALPLLAVAGLLVFTILSAVTPFLPTVLFSVAASIIPPLALGISLALGVIVACVHLYRTHDKQIDNEYKLDYADEDEDAHQAVPTNAEEFNSYQFINANLPVTTRQILIPVAQNNTLRINTQDFDHESALTNSANLVQRSATLVDDNEDVLATYRSSI